MSTRSLSPSLKSLLHPGSYTPFIITALALAVSLGSFLLGSGLTSLSNASLLAFGVALTPVTVKWWLERRYWGTGATALSILLVLQGLHTLEHIAQVVQYYLLGWPAGRSLGLVTAANAEWLHFAWNAGVLAGVIFLFAKGLRNKWMVALLGWALLHTLEHSYLLLRYFQVLAELRTLGLAPVPALQSLPGVLGKDGLLSLSSWCGNLSGLTTAPRVLVHFWWNAGEIALLGLAARQGVPKLLGRTPLKQNLLKQNLLKQNASRQNSPNQKETL